MALVGGNTTDQSLADLERRVHELNNPKLEAILISSSGIIGQAIYCKIPESRLLPLMTANAALLHVLGNNDPRVDKLREEIMFGGVKFIHEHGKPTCQVVFSAFDQLEQLTKNMGLLR